MKYLILLLLLIPTQVKAFTTDEVFQIVNSDRQTPLVRNVKLDMAAQNKADALALCRCLAHNLPDGREPWDFIHQVGYNYWAAGENLAEGYDSVNELNNAWLMSPAHRENIMYPYKETGIGISQGTLGGKPFTFVVQLFGYPK